MVKPEQEQEETEEFKLVGFNRFVRSNPRSDRFPVCSFHHVEFWTADATTAASRFSFSLGLPITAHSDFSTSNFSHHSLLLRRDGLQRCPLSILFTDPCLAATTASAASASIPSFSAATAEAFISHHGGVAVRAIALSVNDAAAAFTTAVANGAVPTFPPTDLGHGFCLAEVALYGDVVLRFVSGSDSSVDFLPGFAATKSSSDLDYGLHSLDHAVGSVEKLGPIFSYMKKFLGFHEFAEFTTEDIGTAESGLNTAVLANNDETVLLSLVEPVHGMRRRSQVQTYLDHNSGPRVLKLGVDPNLDDDFRRGRAPSGDVEA